jgi:hypothetical protein
MILAHGLVSSPHPQALTTAVSAYSAEFEAAAMLTPILQQDTSLTNELLEDLRTGCLQSRVPFVRMPYSIL